MPFYHNYKYYTKNCKFVKENGEICNTLFVSTHYNAKYCDNCRRLAKELNKYGRKMRKSLK